MIGKTRENISLTSEDLKYQIIKDLREQVKDLKEQIKYKDEQLNNAYLMLEKAGIL